MAVTAVVFDVGETLIDETRSWQRLADAAGVPRFTVMAVLGGLAARGEHHAKVWDVLGIAQPPSQPFKREDFYPDAIPCLERMRWRGYFVGAVGNMSAENEDLLRSYVHFVGSSQRWKVDKPAAAFFARVAKECARRPAEVAYVGDRVDNDVAPAIAAGMTAVHIRRGPWAHLYEPPVAALRITSLDELPAVLDG